MGRSVDERRELGSTGITVSPISFGGSPLGNEFGVIDEEEGIRAVHEAVRSGVNFFDVSPYYGRTKAETVLGRALRELPRDSFVVATKVGRYDVDTFEFTPERVTKSVDESLARLGVDYLDVVHCHDIEFGDLDQVATQTIPALLKLKEAGKVKAIGITGYPLEIFPYVLSATPPKSIDVILSYCNLNLQNDRLLHIASSLKKTYGVGVINASPLSMGMLTSGPTSSGHPAGDDIRAAVDAANKICESNDASLAELALQYAFSVQPDVIDTTLVGIESRSRLSQNIKIFESEPKHDLISTVRRAFGSVHNETWESGAFPGRKSLL